VTIRLTATCAAQTTAGQTVAGHPSQVVDVFPGGCVTYRPEANDAASAALLDQAKRAMSFLTRDDLREALLRRSGGRLQLDPEAG
jgi:hypothetical protein